MQSRTMDINLLFRPPQEANKTPVRIFHSRGEKPVGDGRAGVRYTYLSIIEMGVPSHVPSDLLSPQIHPSQPHFFLFSHHSSAALSLYTPIFLILISIPHLRYFTNLTQTNSCYIYFRFRRLCDSLGCVCVCMCVCMFVSAQVHKVQNTDDFHTLKNTRGDKRF